MISENTVKKIEQVANVCIRCRRCMKECIMLNRFAQNPKMLFTEYLQKGPENMDRHIAYSCNECSQCTLKCPKGLNLKAVFQSLKADYAAENQGIVPEASLLPSELGQNRECSPEYCTVLSAGSGLKTAGKARYLFIPGKFPPEQILKHLRSSLGEANVDALSGRVLETLSPELLREIENNPSQVLITACPSSFRTLREALPQRRVLFYWDLMQDLIGIPQETFLEETRLLIHPGDGMGESIHWVLDQLGCQWSEDSAAVDLKTADRDCRQILGLLFGTQDKRKKEQYEN